MILVFCFTERLPVMDLKKFYTTCCFIIYLRDFNILEKTVQCILFRPTEDLYDFMQMK